MTSRALVVVPAFNEAATVAGVVREVVERDFACLVVDDASTDGTARRARDAGAQVVELPINLGVGGALRTGWRYAVDHGFDTVVQVDADGQHPAAHIAALLAALDDDGLDMVVGSRFAPGGAHPAMGQLRRSAVTLLSSVLRRRAGVRISDPTSGLRAIRDPLLQAFATDFPRHYLGDTFEALLVAGRAGYRIGEVPVTMRARQGGTPSAGAYASARAMIRALAMLLTGPSFELPRRG